MNGFREILREWLRLIRDFIVANKEFVITLIIRAIDYAIKRLSFFFRKNYRNNGKR